MVSKFRRGKINVSGGSSSSVFGINSLCHVDRGGAALYLHGSYL